MRVTKPQEKMNLETIDYDNNSILGISVYVTTKAPGFGRQELVTKLVAAGYPEEYLPIEKNITLIKKAAKKALNKSLRSVESEKGTAFLQIDEGIVEEGKDGFKRKDFLADTFFKCETASDKIEEFECSNDKVKDSIVQEIPLVEDILTTSHLFKTITNVLQREFEGSIPFSGNFWFLPSNANLKASVEQLVDFQKQLDGCITLITLPVLDNLENKKNYWDLLLSEINNKVENIAKNTEKMEVESSKNKVKTLLTRIENESVFIKSFQSMFENTSQDLEDRIEEIKARIAEKFEIDLDISEEKTVEELGEEFEVSEDDASKTATKIEKSDIEDELDDFFGTDDNEDVIEEKVIKKKVEEETDIDDFFGQLDEL